MRMSSSHCPEPLENHGPGPSKYIPRLHSSLLFCLKSTPTSSFLFKAPKRERLSKILVIKPMGTEYVKRMKQLQPKCEPHVLPPLSILSMCLCYLIAIYFFRHSLLHLLPSPCVLRDPLLILQEILPNFLLLPRAALVDSLWPLRFLQHFCLGNLERSCWN